ncbi:MAG: hypothetical protein M5R41_10215 [Bacteroidia bacterium]|nr:hypothetical protein [Bacteroidia bacterium]
MRTYTPDQLLLMTLRGELDRVSSEAMVRYCIERTVGIIQWSNGQSVYAQNRLGLGIEDLAFDIVADLVAEQDDTGCALLRHALLQLPHETEEERRMSFEGTLIRNVTQSLSRLLGEFNRAQYLLLRSLRSGVRRRTDIVTLDMLDGRWYMRHDTAHAFLERESIPWEQLRMHIRTSGVQGKALVLELLEDTLDMLDAQSEYRKAVRESDIIRIATEIFASQLQTVADIESLDDQNNDITSTMQSVDSYLLSAIDDVRQRLGEFYDDTQRLSANELDAFVAAAQEYLQAATAGERLTLYSCLRGSMPGLTRLRYRETYRNRFEYFIRKITERLAVYVNAE